MYKLFLSIDFRSCDCSIFKDQDTTGFTCFTSQDEYLVVSKLVKIQTFGNGIRNQFLFGFGKMIDFHMMCLECCLPLHPKNQERMERTLSTTFGYYTQLLRLQVLFSEKPLIKIDANRAGNCAFNPTKFSANTLKSPPVKPYVVSKTSKQYWSASGSYDKLVHPNPKRIQHCVGGNLQNSNDP